MSLSPQQYQQYQESDSDSNGPMLQQALPVNTNIEIDETRPAATAQEYLFRVRLERQKLPKISYAKNFNYNNHNNQNNQNKYNNQSKKSKYFNNYSKYFETSKKDNNNINKKVLPNDKWKQKFVDSFIKNRNILINDIIKESKWNKKHKNLNNSAYFQYKYLNIPNCKNIEKWMKFALNYPDNNDNKLYPVPPLLTLIEQLSPIETEKLLEILMKFVINKYELNGLSGLWIYSLFLRIETPLTPDLTANIRQFARFCINQRNKLQNNESTELIVLTNIFIVIIEKVFKQPCN